MVAGERPRLFLTLELRCSVGVVIGRVAAKLFAINVVDGAKTSVYAVTAPELEGKGYQFLAKSAIAPLKTKLAASVEAQTELWKLSEELLNQDYSL